jgi:phage tail protein X
MIYTTKQGDMFDKIAYEQLGDVNFMDAIMRANPQYRDVYVFSSGVVLDIPEVEDKVTPDTLPPWKQVAR